jgi:site-specific recombinase XerC
MVNRKNYLKVKAYLNHQREVKQFNPRSVDRYWAYLKHLLLWADAVAFCQIAPSRPTFSTYLASARLDGNARGLARSTLRKIIQTTRRFFTWLLVNYPHEFRKFPRSWTDELRPPHTTDPEPVEHKFVTLDQVRQLIALDPGDDVALGRDQAAAAMLFLSGMRASAFGSLPIKAVDLDSGAVKQWPSLGVRTKNGKAATTYLLGIPDLREAARKWDAVIRLELPPTAAWYTPIISRWGEQTLSANLPGKNRGQAIIKRMGKLFDAAGLPYMSPHKFRHGHAVYALQHSRDMVDYKAVSMNLMHADIRVTDAIYAPLAGDDVRQRVTNLSRNGRSSTLPGGKVTASLHDLSDGELSQILAIAAERLKG